NPWKCPHCPFIQHSRRTPDYKRHVATQGNRKHLDVSRCPPAACERSEAHADAGAVGGGVGGDGAREEMVGGCGKTFSRKDAFAR
ncbi:uncharacterized protein BXZ73DRAFT_19917, partial [Epithele typhae]|uniref:uncharacterized protein n=1 Tax=Epithele typhae TaxID=378194 RepID=UPI0020087DD0